MFKLILLALPLSAFSQIDINKLSNRKCYHSKRQGYSICKFTFKDLKKEVCFLKADDFYYEKISCKTEFESLEKRIKYLLRDTQ